MADDDVVQGEGVDERRRDLLKKAGIAAGAVWAAPLVASNFSAASAQGSNSCAGVNAPCRPNPGDPFTQCGTNGLGGICYCADGQCFQNMNCGGEPAAPCPPGWALAPNCCGPDPVCTPLCSSPLGGFRDGARSDASVSGRTGAGDR